MDYASSILGSRPVTLIILAFLTIPIQMLGYATTCTQGDSGSALTGSVISGMLLFAMAVFLLRRGASNELGAISLVVTAILLVGTLALTFSIWLGTIRYGTPCGADFEFYALELPDRVIILFSYLALPTLNVVLCLTLIVRKLSVQKSHT